ncbi:cysteine hydrolase [Bradyrhizobium sp. Pear77]|uniref:cysteine hydrolase family protein n=1 Tax=Bradyrhizobium altum TaxID=1571202 RepID=UPI001E656692|nr:isochorismatase family cysteine hydrolase [Bradyrhizobium altum]MCC8957665.1 cysteine hydrolase [Bradyrhizobium altum]
MKLETNRTAVLSLDAQGGTLRMIGSTPGEMAKAAQVVAAARRASCSVIHVCLGFEVGYPEISPANTRFSALKEHGLFIKGTESVRPHPSIFEPGDLVVYKHRTSAFSGNALQMILHAKGIETLVLFGFATSGIVLSTLRQAADLDFKCIVIKDACFDRDEEVHRVLTEKVFAAQATVMTAQEFENMILQTIV